MVLECAQESQADYIVSRDVHLLELDKFEGSKIVTAEEILEILD